MQIKIGHSKDIHRLEYGRKLIIGGVELKHDYGLVGHSDADVLLHAITESIIGAMGLGDIGTFFPDTDPKYKNIDSTLLLRETIDIMYKNNYKINNIDSTIFAEQPKMLTHVPKMRKVIASICGVDETKINIKATRGEKVGIIGREEAIGAEAVVLLMGE